jgi:flagellar motor switch protein FliN/FliY
MSAAESGHVGSVAEVGIAERGGASPLDALREVSLPVVIEIGRTSLTVDEVLQLAAGTVIELERSVGDAVDVYVGDRRIAQAEVVVIGEHFGVRITRILAPDAEAA